MNTLPNQISHTHFQTPLSVGQTRRLLAYLLRGMVLRVQKGRIGEHRYKGLAGELATTLIPSVVSTINPFQFFRTLCLRFAVDVTGGDSDYGHPVEAWLPEGRIRWDRVLALFDHATLRKVVEESPEFLATFARDRGHADDDAEFALFPDESEERAAFVPELPSSDLIVPSGYRAVWTLTRPIHHGADQKSGNVNMFRRQPGYDARTGRECSVPFLSGNSIRGQWRDMVMSRWLELIGLSPEEIPAIRAHALLSGGTIEQGADTATVDNVIRREARDKCPPWDLIAGNINQQTMGGWLRVGDAVVVCRENAWLVHGTVAPDMDPDEFAESLPEAEAMLTIQQFTRRKHADIDQSEGMQSLIHQEVLKAGSQMIHTVSLFGLTQINPVTASCLADLLEHFQFTGSVGASAARGRGNIAFDRYKPGPNTPELPSPDLYLETVEKRRDEMVEWAMSAMAKAERKKSPRGKSKTEEAVAQ